MAAAKPFVDGVPRYVQIAEVIEAQHCRHREPGDEIPNEIALAAKFDVNRHTIRHAVDQLVARGLIERRRGLGLFVSGPLLYAIDKGTRFTERLSAAGEDSRSVVLRKDVIKAESGVARRLGMPARTKIAVVETLREVRDWPFCISTHFLRVPDPGLVVDRYEGGSLHRFLSASFGFDLERTESVITSTLPTVEDAKFLRLPPSMPVLRVKSVNIEVRSGAPVEYALTRFRGDRVQLSVDLSQASADRDGERASAVASRSQNKDRQRGGK